MKKKLITFTVIGLMLFSCGGGGDSSSGNYNSYVGNPQPEKTTSTINGTIDNISSLSTNGKLYIVAVSVNDLGLPVRELEPINQDGSFTMELDKNKEYAFFIQNDKNEYITAIKDRSNIIGLTFTDDETDLRLSYNGSFVDNLSSVSVSYNSVFNKDTDNDNVPFIADFTEVNEYFNYKVYYDNFSPNVASLKDIFDYKWSYMHYSNIVGYRVIGFVENRNTDKPLFSEKIYCVSVKRNPNATKADLKIEGKIFRRIEGKVPVYVRDDVSQKTKDTLKQAIADWNKAFKEAGIDNQIKLYYAGEVIENKYFYNAINDNWRGFYLYTTYNSQTRNAGATLENSFWNDIDSSFKLSNVDDAITLKSFLFPFNTWKPRIDKLMNLYPDGVFYVEYKYDQNGNPVDYGAVITQIGKPMKGIVMNSYYESRSEYKYAIEHEIGHALGLYHPFDFETYYTNYQYIPDLKGKKSIMNYDDNNATYPVSYTPSAFDKQVLKYIYSFSTSEEITINNVSQFLKVKCGL